VTIDHSAHPPGFRYEPFSAAAVRAPTAPAGAVSSPEVVQILEERAIALASPSLASALAAGQDNPRLARAVRNYRLRMALRATPFGLFAGVGMTSWGDSTTLTITRVPEPAAHVPMKTIATIVHQLEADPAVLAHCRLVADPLILLRAGRAWLGSRMQPDVPAQESPISVKASAPVLAILAAAEHQQPFDVLVAAAGAAGAAPERAADLVVQLTRLGFLHSHLRPSLTGELPVSLVDRLAGIAAAEPVKAVLRQAEEEAARWNQPASELWPGEAPGSPGHRSAAPGGPSAGTDPPSRPRLFIDTRLTLGGTLARSIAADLADAASTLLRLSPFPNGSRQAELYRESFDARFGTDRFVPLAVATHPEFGPGAPPHLPVLGHKPERDALLVDLAEQSLRSSRRLLLLDDELLNRLIIDPAVSTGPDTVELIAAVLAASPGDIDRGSYELMLGPSPGDVPAGRSLARFADMLGLQAVRLLRDVLDRHRAAHPEALWAEFSYLPGPAEGADLVLHPMIGEWELALGVRSCLPRERVIPPDELRLVSDGRRLRLWWPRYAREVRLVANHRLVPASAPPVAELLSYLADDGHPSLVRFYWGVAELLPALPRVQRGRTILRAAEWHLTPSARQALEPERLASFFDRLSAWRERWDVPPQVHMIDADRWVPLDLEDREHVEEVRRTLRKQTSDVVLSEALPSRGHAWLSSPLGAHVAEVCVQLHRAGADAGRPPALPLRSAADSALPDAAVARQAVIEPPGGRWAYLALITGPDRREELVGRLASLPDGVRELTDRWFFVRYSQPEEQLRVRLRCSPVAAPERLLTTVLAWADTLRQDGYCDRVTLETYLPEVDRYGGPRAIDAVERVFHADSEFVASLVGLDHRRLLPEDRIVVLAAGIDDVFACFGLSAADRWPFYSSVVIDTELGSRLYRDHGAALRRVLARSVRSQNGRSSSWSAGSSVDVLFEQRAAAITAAVDRLRRLEDQGSLTQPLPRIASAIAHMHANRLLGPRHASEAATLNLLSRVLRGLLIQGTVQATPTSPLI
jgi:thiopeptide-type bacteriocin biosynthesis protein